MCMLSCGNKDFNAFLNVGIEGITTIYGKAGTGKTCFCLMVAVENAKHSKVVYIDTENGFTIDRLKQIAKEQSQTVMDNLILLRTSSFKDQHKKITNIEKLTKNVSLVIVDTLSNHYRRFTKVDKELAKNMLNLQMEKLYNLSKKGVSVIVTNQVFTNTSMNKFEMVGYSTIFPYSQKVVEFTKNQRRIAFLRKPGLSEFIFDIKEEGIVSC